MTTSQRTTLLRVLALVAVIAVSVGLFLFRDQLQHLESLGYAGVFLIGLVSSATIILPVPGVLVTSVMGAVFDPFWVALAAGTGAALGELSGYLAGFSGRGVVERADIHVKMEAWMRRFGGATILVFALIPNPLFDVVGMVAGALKMPIWKFLVWCWFGEVAKMMLFAYTGGKLVGIFHP
jgi:uncharacterized membrane protein YdjX (TVP38/TMEM64 family)